MWSNTTSFLKQEKERIIFSTEHKIQFEFQYKISDKLIRFNKKEGTNKLVLILQVFDICGILSSLSTVEVKEKDLEPHRNSFNHVAQVGNNLFRWLRLHNCLLFTVANQKWDTAQEDGFIAGNKKYLFPLLKLGYGQSFLDIKLQS